MNSLVVVFLAIAVAVQAKPYMDFGPMMGGMGYGSGGGYGDSSYGGGRRGYMNQGHRNNIFSAGHNIGHVQDDFDADVHHHQYSDHNIGGMMQNMNGGHNMAGYNGYNRGHNMYGNRWNNGFY